MTPSPKNSLSQPQEKEPGVFAHVAFSAQLSKSRTHSSISGEGKEQHALRETEKGIGVEALKCRISEPVQATPSPE